MIKEFTKVFLILEDIILNSMYLSIRILISSLMLMLHLTGQLPTTCRAMCEASTSRSITTPSVADKEESYQPGTQ